MVGVLSDSNALTDEATMDALTRFVQYRARWTPPAPGPPLRMSESRPRRYAPPNARAVRRRDRVPGLAAPQPPPDFIRNNADTEKIGCVDRARRSRNAGWGGLLGFAVFVSVGSLAAVARNCRRGTDADTGADTGAGAGAGA